MSGYTEAEISLLLLCVLPGDDPPVTEARYRQLMNAAVILGPKSDDRDEALSPEELAHLGCTVSEAEAILRRMERRKELELYLSGLERDHVRLLTRLSPDYPQRLRDRLGDKAPLFLFCIGNVGLMNQDCISLVGSRKLREEGKRFAQRAGKAIAEASLCYCSGGAAGTDTEGFLAADRAGGSAVLFLADSLVRHRFDRRYISAIEQGRLLLVSEFGEDQKFTAFRALSRNRLIHALGNNVLVAQTDYGAGGTWNGCMENLKAGWSPVFMFDGEGEDPGTRGLIDCGAEPISMEDLSYLRGLMPSQARLF